MSTGLSALSWSGVATSALFVVLVAVRASACT
jgi:hypothetical protein